MWGRKCRYVFSKPQNPYIPTLPIDSKAKGADLGSSFCFTKWQTRVLPHAGSVGKSTVWERFTPFSFTPRPILTRPLFLYPVSALSSPYLHAVHFCILYPIIPQREGSQFPSSPPHFRFFVSLSFPLFSVFPPLPLFLSFCYSLLYVFYLWEMLKGRMWAGGAGKSCSPSTHAKPSLCCDLPPYFRSTVLTPRLPLRAFSSSR